MYILIVLATMTNLGTYPSQVRCETAIRQLYEQKIDPYHQLDRKMLKEVVDFNMQYDAPRKYRCQKV